MSAIDTMMQDMKAGFRRIEIQQHKFETSKRKNMDKYFQQVLNGKKLRYFNELNFQQEQYGKISTVKQITDRVQNIKKNA